MDSKDVTSAVVDLH